MNLFLKILDLYLVLAQDGDQDGAELRKQKKEKFQNIKQAEIDEKREKVKASKEKSKENKGKKAAEIQEKNKQAGNARRQEKVDNKQNIKEQNENLVAKNQERKKGSKK